MSRSEEKRAAIVKAAVEEFSTAGYAAANMDAIAARAQVSKRTVYNHFASKEALFLDISSGLCSQVMGATEVPFDPGRGTREQLLELARRYLDTVSSEEFLVMVRVILPERVRNPDLARGEFDRLRRGETGLGRWMEQAMEAGALRPGDPRDCSRRFASILSEFGFWPQVIAHEPVLEPAERDRVAAEATALFLQGMAPEA